MLGGPFADSSGSLVVLEDVTAEEARELLAPDPFLANGVFELADARELLVYVDELSR